MAKRKKPFAQFFSMIDKNQRSNFIKEAIQIIGCSRSAFYYKTLHGNLYPCEAVKIKQLLVRYGAKDEDLRAMGILG